MVANSFFGDSIALLFVCGCDAGEPPLKHWISSRALVPVSCRIQELIICYELGSDLRVTKRNTGFLYFRTKSLSLVYLL